MAVHLGEDGENLIKQVATYIDETLQAEGVPPKAEKVLSVVTSKLQELEEDAEEERHTNNARNGPILLQVMAMEPRSRSRKVEQIVLMLMLPHQS
jgi:hypothetical protein